MSKLNDLDTSLQPVQPLILETTVSSSLQSLLKVRASGILEAEHTGTGLVQVLDERDVEVGYVGTETKVHVGERGAMRAVDRD